MRAVVAHSAVAQHRLRCSSVLAVDVSGSVSQVRFELQRQGYAEAFRSAAVQQAIRSTGTGSVAIAMLQWTGPSLHVVAVDWTFISDTASAERFAAAIEHAPRALFGGGTSISGAIDYAMTLFPGSPFQGPVASSTFPVMAPITAVASPRMRATRPCAPAW